MDKDKKSPLPEKTATVKEAPKLDKQSRDPQFVRGTIDPPTKK
jgi:hypothetical protein